MKHKSAPFVALFLSLSFLTVLNLRAEAQTYYPAYSTSSQAEEDSDVAN